MPVKITADSTCDLPLSILQQYGFDVLRMHVSVGDRHGRDGDTIVQDDIYNYYKATKKLPVSASCSPDEVAEFFKTYTDQGYDVIHFCVSDKLSSCCNNAVTASKNFNNVYVVDSMTLSTGTALLMMDAHDCLQQGMSVTDVVERERQLANSVQASFVLDTLEFMCKGGRCSSISYLGANLLQIKPCIETRDGKMNVGKKYFGNLKRVITKYVADTLNKYNTPNKKRCFVTHTRMPEGITDMVVELVKSYGIFDEVLDTDAGSTITTHCGPGTLGILYINNGDETISVE